MLKRSAYVLFFALFTTLNLATPTAAQNSGWTADKVGFNSGQGVITSGLDAKFVATSNTNRIYLRANSDRFYLKYGWDITNWLRLDASGGAFKFTPWLGPQVTFSFDLIPVWTNGGAFTNYTWAGVSFGDEKLNLENTKAMFWQNTSFLSLGAFSNTSLLLSYSAVRFRIVPPNRVLHMTGARYKVPAKFKDVGTVQFSLGIAVDLNADSYTPLWNFGVTLEPDF